MGIKKDMTIPPGYRRVLKNGRLKYTPRILFFQKKTAALNLVFQNRRKATCSFVWAHKYQPPKQRFFYMPFGG
ncbi:MAG: hypothetical protein HFF17_12960 [Oscillospiraceae bacterium]|nr:hypothetical protein [Oscillospiraceae bacterium]